jgi:hypothetical protein
MIYNFHKSNQVSNFRNLIGIFGGKRKALKFKGQEDRARFNGSREYTYLQNLQFFGLNALNIRWSYFDGSAAYISP